MLYSASTGGFYLPEIHGGNIPSDAVEISAETHAALMAGQSAGQRIVADLNGIPFLAAPPPLTSAAYAAALQHHIDETATVRGYGNGVMLASYVASTNAAWAAEAAAFVAWRDAVWLAAYEELAEVQSGAHPAPTIEAFIAGLPAITWPA